MPEVTGAGIALERLAFRRFLVRVFSTSAGFDLRLLGIRRSAHNRIFIL
jgi:hypothetical protein